MNNIGYKPSNFYCTMCGKKNFNVYRKCGQERKGGHLKKLYCIYCQEETNNVEIKENDITYTYEDFLEEFKSGRFVNGNRVEIKDLPQCSLNSCRYNLNGQCWNANDSADCPYKPLWDKKCIIIMMGLPGAGKSTYSKKLAKKIGCICISFDDFSIIKRKYKLDENYWKILDEIIKNNPITIIDSLHLRKNERTYYSRYKNYQKYCVWIQTPIDISKERNNKRIGSKRVPDTAISYLEKSFQDIKSNENFDAVYILDENYNIKDIIRFTKNNIDNLIKEVKYND